MLRLLTPMIAILIVLVAVEPAAAQRRMQGMVRRGRQNFKIPKPKPAINAPAAPVVNADPIVAADQNGTADAAILEQAKARLDKEFAALNRQRQADGKPALPAPAADAPRAMIDMAHYGMHYVNGQSRFLALHLIVHNPGKEPLVIPRGDVTMKIDAEAVPLADLANGPQFSFSYGPHHQNLQNDQQLKELKVPAGGVGGAWLVYPNLPMNSDVPPVSLSIKLPGRTMELDVTESQRALMNVQIEALGPRKCLRLLTVRGTVNTVNVQSLVTTLEQNTERQIVRYVIQWTPESTPPENTISQWLVQSALQIGTGRPVNEQLPTLPATIREFHLVPQAGHNFPNTDAYGRPGGQKLHANLAEAISASLKSAYFALPPSELKLEMQEGHPLTRAAALRHGAARLSGDGLTVVLPRLDDENADIREAAVRALSQFGEPAALDALVELANDPADPLCQAAFESLAASRFAGAQARLLELLRTTSGDAKRQLMQVLARYPRPQWAEEIYAYVTDPKEKLPVDGVRALLQVGHPNLVDVLEACLKSENAEARELAFPILAQRSDARSERLATEYTMAQLAKQPPDGNVSQFLYRTKLPQSLPLLLKHLEASSDRKNEILNLLAQIGDDSVVEAVAAKYPKLQPAEKGTALNTLRMLRYPKFLDLAAEALLSNDASMVGQATQGLMQDGGAEAARLLITALEKQQHQFAISQICNALSNVGGPDARSALLKARDSDNAQRKQAAINALQNLFQRSPGYQYIWQAQEPLRHHKWNDAIQFFEMSLEIDPELPEALAGRGLARRGLGKVEDAAKDLEKAYEIDPYNRLVIPGLALIRLQAGKLDDGLKILTTNRDRYQHDQIFLYYSAAAYAQALDQAQKQTELPDRDKRIEEYRGKAVSELQLAMSRGWGDVDVIRNDADFKVLKDDPEFKKLIGNRPQPKKDDDQPADAIKVE